MEMVDGIDTDKREWIKLKFFMDPDNPALNSKYIRHLAISKDECPEEKINCFLVDVIPGD
jgi:hypothetical protein